MLSNNNPPPASEEMRQAAAAWFVLNDRGLTPAQQLEFSSWLEADLRHAEAYAEFESTWSLLGEAGDSARPAAVSAPRPRPIRPWAWVPVALAAGLVLAFVYDRGGRRWAGPASGPAADAPYTELASTGVGEVRRWELPDGSLLQLNTDSVVEVRLTAKERDIRLMRGEAHFKVAKNPARPFIVSAVGVSVRAVGTAFDVRLREDSVDVLVTEGKVRVGDAVRAQSLVAGERAIIPLDAAHPAGPAIAVESGAIEKALAWRERRLEFESQPLSEIVAEFNRYNQHKLVIADPALAGRRFGGTFPADDCESLVRVLERTSEVVAEGHGDVTVLRSAH